MFCIGSEATGANWLRAFAQSGCVETLLNIDEPEHLQTAVDNVIRLLSEGTCKSLARSSQVILTKVEGPVAHNALSVLQTLPCRVCSMVVRF